MEPDQDPPLIIRTITYTHQDTKVLKVLPCSMVEYLRYLRILIFEVSSMGYQGEKGLGENLLQLVLNNVSRLFCFDVI